MKNYKYLQVAILIALMLSVFHVHSQPPTPPPPPPPPDDGAPFGGELLLLLGAGAVYLKKKFWSKDKL